MACQMVEVCVVARRICYGSHPPIAGGGASRHGMPDGGSMRRG
eukprot:CAMPEP_0202031496 /NCGR_PEP_ID=MMETSP0905-20130828/65047_1 /ASSEMBLY_ACC=CAM_ASM_000554 /TAXON_ID=420261 /ORGANISM="Thalassiosira antarctica, Strain CCMP982" /LENGTH=42 /DNA_ID= /DNA_START= /DNA_END= /DNA_ORIENTATION=